MYRLVALLCGLAVAGCGGGNGSGGDGGGGDDPCGFGNDDFLPYEVGFSWSFRVTDLGTGNRSTKEQRIDPGMNHPTHGEVVVQVTEKLNGTTTSYLRREGGRVLRFEQQDRDETMTLERTTTYVPSQIRIDESDERTMFGATWNETYTEVVRDPAGTLVSEIETVDGWEVMDVDVDCEAPFGAFSCIHLRRVRTQGGVAEKDFYFARGVGKVREVGANQLEELTACGPVQ